MTFWPLEAWILLDPLLEYNIFKDCCYHLTIWAPDFLCIVPSANLIDYVFQEISDQVSFSGLIETTWMASHTLYRFAGQYEFYEITLLANSSYRLAPSLISHCEILIIILRSTKYLIISLGHWALPYGSGLNKLLFTRLFTIYSDYKAINWRAVGSASSCRVQLNHQIVIVLYSVSNYLAD